MTYLVAFSPNKDDTGVIDLAGQLARSRSAAVQAVTVVPQGWETGISGGTDREFNEWAAGEGEAGAAAALRLFAEHPDITATASWVTGRSVPQALDDQVAAQGADFLVVGSGTNGPRGFVTITSKTQRLLHSSQVPVVIAPRGYRAPAGTTVERVTIAFRDDDTSWSLLDRTAALCQEIGARLRLMTIAVRKPGMVTSGARGMESLVHQQWRQQAQAGLDEAGTHLAGQTFGGAAVDLCLAEGRSWEGALDTVEWGRGDLLVVGSSRTNPIAHVFLGSSASKILRHSTVPVVVVP